MTSGEVPSVFTWPHDDDTIHLYTHDAQHGTVDHGPVDFFDDVEAYALWYLQQQFNNEEIKK